MESKPKSSPKKQTFSWKALIVAFIVALFLNMFISAAAGIEPRKNITWTVFWIYLSIVAWKSWKWKALLPYPLYIVLTIISTPVIVATGFNYLSWTHLLVVGFLNIGGLLTFYLLLNRTQNNQEIVAVQNRTKRDNWVVGDTESDFKKPNINTFPERIKVKKAPSRSKNKGSEMKGTDDIAINENKLYKQIWREIEENKTDLGLWAKCFASCDGDNNKTKALYVNERVLALKGDDEAKIATVLAEQLDKTPEYIKEPAKDGAQGEGCIKCHGYHFKHDKYFDEYICTDCGFSTSEKPLIVDNDVDGTETKNTNKMLTDYSDQYEQLKNDFSEKLSRIERRTSFNIKNIKNK